MGVPRLYRRLNMSSGLQAGKIRPEQIYKNDIYRLLKKHIDMTMIL